MTDAEQQADEMEAIKAIFEGDELFTVISDTVVQYKFGVVLSVFCSVVFLCAVVVCVYMCLYIK